ncbi:MAG: peptide-methionine (S)-S-oxide reductase MsrA [Gemmatimonadales bacterium]
MTELATLAGGCFWCLEAAFEQLKGVSAVTSGYAGGAMAEPTYEAVCSGTTGHAEVVQVTFDPAVIGFRDLLDVFFTIHDPTTLNRQGNDVGTQYRSAIFTHSPEQAAVAREVIADLTSRGAWDDPIVTEVVPLDHFWPAEPYHHDYFRRNPNQPYCMFVVAPKVAKLRKEHMNRLRA